MFNQQEESRLPTLRDDIKLIEAAPAEDGSKQWMLFDPIPNKYYTIGIDTFELINHWQNDALLSEFIIYLNRKDYDIDEEGLSIFINFLKSNSLVKNIDAKDTSRLIEQKKNSKQNIFKWLIHNYLFIKIPIFKPDRWLEKNLSKVQFFYSKLWTNFILVLGVIGVLMVIRQWEEFSSTFMYLFSKEGMIYYFLSLIFVKTLHELGHAFTAKKYGCTVPSMGVAFLVLFPVLYTDNTNAYALKSKYKRLRIVLAGMKVEIYLAIIATFLWSFLPEGPLKSIAFIIATTSWITSLLVNISPFLRFDGYYALSDWTNTKNLQPRSFATTKWFLRKYLLGLDDEEPEVLSQSKRRFFVTYAILTWIYRFFLFLGIAVLVYYFAFKVLGIVLFLIEILWFIFIPVFKELKIWWDKREKVSWNKRNKISFFVFILIVAFLFLPWSSSLSLPAVVEAKQNSLIYTPKAAKIVSINVKNDQEVKKGDTLMVLESDEIELQIQQTKTELLSLKDELDLIASSKENLGNRFVIEENILEKEITLKGLAKSKEELNIKAAFDGKVYFKNRFKIGQWVNPQDPIFYLYNTNSSYVIAYVEDYNLKYIANSENGKFIANNGVITPLNVDIENISKVSLINIEYPELSSLYNGEIAVRQDSQDGKKLITEKAYFKIDAKLLDNNYKFNTRVDGVLYINSQNSSFITRFFELAYNTVIKESGF
jgi:putative peptide zinc metalloprotease protein